MDVLLRQPRGKDLNREESVWSCVRTIGMVCERFGTSERGREGLERIRARVEEGSHGRYVMFGVWRKRRV